VFLKGIGLSVYQNSGDSSSNWATFVKKKNMFGGNRVKNAEQITTSCDFWNRYEEDIGLAKEFGINTFRLSIEWARLEPNRGQIDMEAVERYYQILACLDRNNIVPMATLHHFTHPQWFEELGGFTKEENIPYFVDYAKNAFRWFGPKIRLWGTFNEPTCFSFCGYIMGLWSPGSRMMFRQAGVCLLNLLRCHTETYRAIKSMPGGEQARVGLVHQFILFEPKNTGIAAAYIRPLTSWMTFWFGTDVLMTYLLSGEFIWKSPFKGITVEAHDGRPPLDWLGINYYSRLTIDWKFGVGGTSGEQVSDTGFPIHPGGMYRSIKMAGELDVPIYITEWGMADSRDDRRHYLIGAYFNQIMKAISDGYPVRGIYYWTLMDNIEWHEGFHVKYGLYEWSPGGNGDRRLREHSKVLKTLYAALPTTIGDVKKMATTHRQTSSVSAPEGVDAEPESAEAKPV